MISQINGDKVESITLQRDADVSDSGTAVVNLKDGKSYKVTISSVSSFVDTVNPAVEKGLKLTTQAPSKAGNMFSIIATIVSIVVVIALFFLLHYCHASFNFATPTFICWNREKRQTNYTKQ